MEFTIESLIEQYEAKYRDCLDSIKIQRELANVYDQLITELRICRDNKSDPDPGAAEGGE